jgi:hypothetical protein
MARLAEAVGAAIARLEELHSHAGDPATEANAAIWLGGLR